jgi:hypothetical protein
MAPSLPIRLRSIGLAGLTAACGGERGGKPSAPPATVMPEAAVPVDSLALRTPGGGEIWFTLAREERDSTGASCVERTLEVRGPRRLPIPLLYTRDIPRLVNDSTVSARIWNHCVPGDEYLINLRTGQPVRARK